VYPVNPRHHGVLGVCCCASIAEVPEPVDLTVIATPAATVSDRVAECVAECVAAGVWAAIVIFAGFRQVGEEGRALEAPLVEVHRDSAVALPPLNSSLARRLMEQTRN
jgi:acetyltransferase